LEPAIVAQPEAGIAVIEKTPVESLIAGQLSTHTRKAYVADIKQFIAFIGGEDRLCFVSKDTVVDFRDYLAKYERVTATGGVKRYQPTTINRKLSVVRQLLAEAADKGVINRNPAARVQGLQINRDYSPTQGLSRHEARQVLDAIDTTTLIGKRDHALLSLLIRTGLRRDEVVRLTLASIGERDGHKVLTVIGKGEKRRLTKLPVDVWRVLDEWLTAAELSEPESSVFAEVRKRGRGAEAVYFVNRVTPLTTDGVWHIVGRRVREAGITKNITPHSLRHTFVTLALAGGAPLHKVQYCAGHADPRTTERYDRQRDDLDNNAVDYIKL